MFYTAIVWHRGCMNTTAHSASFVSVHSTALTAAVAESAADGNVWLQLIPAGTFKGRTGVGPFNTGDRTSMNAIVTMTKRYAGSTDLVIDYDHQSVFSAIPGVGGRAPAAGWIKELAVRDDGIWGRVEWTQAAASAVKAGEYKYLSPVFLHDKAGKVQVIRMAALTNTPQLDLVTVTASSLLIPQPLSSLTDGQPMETILKALGLAADASEADILAAIKKMQDGSADVAKAAGLKESANSAQIVQAVNSAFAAVKDKGDAQVDPTKYVPIEMFTTLQQSVNSMTATLAEEKATEAVRAGMAAGKITPAQKEHFLAMYKKDSVFFEQFMSTAPVLTASQLPAAKRPAGDAVLDDADQAVMSMMGLSQEEFLKTRKQEIG
jgi:phage I-like protein